MDGERMNWKRGLTRLYVALWVAGAVTVGVFVVQKTREDLDFLRRVRSGLAECVADTSLATFCLNGEVWTGPKGSMQEWADANADVTTSQIAERDTKRHLASNLGWWLVGAVLAPAALLFGFRWVWAGFERTASAP